MQNIVAIQMIEGYRNDRDFFTVSVDAPNTKNNFNPTLVKHSLCYTGTKIITVDEFKRHNLCHITYVT